MTDHDDEIRHDEVRRAHGYHALQVKRVVEETCDARSLVFDIPEDLRETFRYRPGQFCTFRVRIDGDEYLRSYSMSSAPETDADLTVTVKRVPGGVVSNWLLDRVTAGDILETSKPAGVFCLRDTDSPVVAFCGGSGVTPVMSIAKSALTSTARPVRMIYANRDRDSVIFADALDAMCQVHTSRFEVHHHLDVDAGFLDAGAIAQLAGGAGGSGGAGADFYICGPGPFMDLVESTLLDLGVAPADIFIERFLVDESPPAAGAVDVAPEGTVVPETVTVIMKGKKTSIAYQAGDTLLETARRGALQPPFSCEAGNCATCMAMLHEGTVTMRANNALTPEEVAEGWVLTCQAVPAGPVVTVEYEAM